MNGWDGHSGGVLLHFGGLFLGDLLKIERERGGGREGERETQRERCQKAWHGLCRTCYCMQII